MKITSKNMVCTCFCYQFCYKFWLQLIHALDSERIVLGDYEYKDTFFFLIVIISIKVLGLGQQIEHFKDATEWVIV